ncbi:DNA replication regulator SLD3-domain-containing protein [Schizophyllum commune]
MTVVNPLRYALSAGDNIAWTATQEKQILKDVPWNDIGQSDEQAESFIARTYLQYLWLPESIMPLHGLVYALRRIVHANPADTNAPHPLHALIEPLLLTARSAAHKYHIELTAILAEGGGAGEAEEAMMWFAYEHEKHEAASSTGGQPSNSQQSNDPESNEDADAQWQARWLNRMERREAQIQILLYLLKLSLPPSPTADSIASPAKKHAAAMQQDSSPRKRRRKSPEPAPLAPEVYLEAFMDKLSMWQLVRGLEDDRRSEVQQDDERDWMQVFCEDVVEPLFKPTLPELCALLRSKVFPHSPFSDEETRTSSSSGVARTSSSANLRASGSQSRASSSKPHAHSSQSRASTSQSHARQLARARSMSLSQSLAQEEADRAAGAGVKRKREISREVSMSRILRPGKSARGDRGDTPGSRSLTPMVEDARTKEKTREKAKEKKEKELGSVLVGDTPVKKATKVFS